jgi:hypothetical protein
MTVHSRQSGVTGLMAVALFLVGVFSVGAGLGQATGALPWLDFARRDAPPARPFPVLDPSPPVRLAIPSLDVRVPVFAVGLARDGSIAAPPAERHREAGWYEGGPTPGQYGPAIIVGHVDARNGPSIFHDLAGIRAGATIEVTRRDRTVAVFEVGSVERFGKSALPADRVYGDYSRPALRLITCGGRWLSGGRGYADNVVVFATLVGSRLV